MNSFLVTGGTREERAAKIFELAKKQTQIKNLRSTNNPDFLNLEGEPSIGIEEIRNMQNYLALKPFEQSHKIVVIGKAENLTIEAQNALLKILEDPPKDSLLVLGAADQSWLLPTIVSRCQIIQLSAAPQISLTDQETKELLKVFKEISSPKVGERWQSLEKLGIFQDRGKALEWINKMIFFGRTLLIDLYLREQKSSSFLISQYFKFLTSLSGAKTHLEANTNIRLTLENFLLDL